MSELRLQVGNPDTLKVTANLGSRGSTEPDVFWIRYTAQNSAGGYEQKNIACRRVYWVLAYRDEYVESKLVDALAENMAKRMQKRMRELNLPVINPELDMQLMKSAATKAVYVSPSDPIFD